MNGKLTALFSSYAVLALAWGLSTLAHAEEQQSPPTIPAIQMSHPLYITGDQILLSEDKEKQPFVIYQGAQPAIEGVTPFHPYCHLWLKKPAAKYVGHSNAYISMLPSELIQIKKKRIDKGLNRSFTYDVTHSWITQIYCKNTTRLEDTRNIMGVLFAEGSTSKPPVIKKKK